MEVNKDLDKDVQLSLADLLGMTFISGLQMTSLAKSDEDYRKALSLIKADLLKHADLNGYNFTKRDFGFMEKTLLHYKKVLS